MQKYELSLEICAFKTRNNFESTGQPFTHSSLFWEVGALTDIKPALSTWLASQEDFPTRVTEIVKNLLTRRFLQTSST